MVEINLYRIMSVLHWRKLRLREIKLHAKGYIAAK